MKKCLLSLAIIMLASSIDVFACTCDLDVSLLRKSKEQQIKIARKRAVAMFSGKVTEIIVDEKTNSYRAKFQIQNSWKKVDSEEVIVRGTMSCCICEYVFKVGESYLVYANDYDQESGEYRTSICTRTKPLENAGDDLAVLGKGKAHKTQSNFMGRDAYDNFKRAAHRRD